MPKLGALTLVVLECLQKRAQAGGQDCPFRKCLNSVLDLAELAPKERAKIDLDAAVKDWPGVELIATRLASNYAKMLDQAPDGEREDFLVWDALDVVGVYADPNKEPDAEHLCIAALVLEGVASDIASANWDGLVEKAVDRLSGGAPTLRVWVRGEDARADELKADLYKFHGCAVLAGQNEDLYRDKLVARQNQIDGWVGQNPVLAARLTELVTTKPTLMLGLSVQDANIRGVFVAAEQRMPWPWPSHPPAYVFSENQLGVDQQGLIRNVYRAAHTAQTRQAMYDGAVLRAYAKPLLAALWLFVITAKLSALIARTPGGLSDGDQEQLRAGLRMLRDKVAQKTGAPGIESFMREALLRSRRIMALFRAGEEPTDDMAGYLAISAAPVQQLEGDPALASSGLVEFAVALGLLGRLIEDDGVRLTTENPEGNESAALKVQGASAEAPLFFAANGQAALRLFSKGHLSEDDDAIVVHSHAVPQGASRSPRRPRGRAGRARLRQASITELLAGAADGQDLLQQFREKVSL